MKNKILIFLPTFILFFFVVGKAQVSVVNIQLMPYNITPEGLLSATLMNNGSSLQIQVVSKLYNFNNELLVAVKSNNFTANQGLNSPFDGNRKVLSVEYTASNQANYIKTTHGLPSGAFKICISVIQSNTSEIVDEYCDEIESNFNQYLYLVYPGDKDTIETKTPLLTWAHSEPFSVLTQGEYYRMVVSEIKEKQGAEEAVTINNPIMVKTYLTMHSLQYPYDAKELIEGRQYAWQVQKLSNGIITNKTEAWEFVLRIKPEEKEIKYVALKQSVDAGYYIAYNGKIYFKFYEDYNSSGSITAFIKDDKGKETPIKITKDDDSNATIQETKIKVMGDNRFILDLNNSNYKSGNYLMIIKNEKKETFYLKFNLPQ